MIDGDLYTKDGKKLVRALSATGRDALVIPEGVSAIGDSAFSGCDLKRVTLPEGLVTIGADAFSDCENLESVNIPESVEELMFSAFDNCPRLTLSLKGGSIAEEYAKDNCYKYEARR